MAVAIREARAGVGGKGLASSELTSCWRGLFGWFGSERVSLYVAPIAVDLRSMSPRPPKCYAYRDASLVGLLVAVSS